MFTMNYKDLMNDRQTLVLVLYLRCLEMYIAQKIYIILHLIQDIVLFYGALFRMHFVFKNT